MINTTYHHHHLPTTTTTSTTTTNQQAPQHNIVINNVTPTASPSYNDPNMACVTASQLLHSAAPIAVGVNYMHHHQIGMQPQQQLHPDTTTVGATMDGSPNATTKGVIFDYRQLQQQTGNAFGKTPLAVDAMPSTTTTTATSSAITAHTPIYIANGVAAAPHHLPITQHVASRSAATGNSAAYNNIRILPAQQQRHAGKTSNGLTNELPPLELVSYQEAQDHHHHLSQLHHTNMPIFLPSHLASQSHYAAAATAVHHHLPLSAEHTLQLQPQQLYVQPSAEAHHCGITTTSSTTMPPSIADDVVGGIVATQTRSGGHDEGGTKKNTAAASSTVLLERINICINNHYMDASTTTATTGGAKATLFTAQQQQQLASPIIPAIQHKMAADSNYASNASDNSDVQLVIDEPDSTTNTTTPQTPPTTPELGPQTTSPNGKACKPIAAVCSSREQAATALERSITFTPPTPPTPSPPSSECAYVIGEDVFIKRPDGRFYLGTIIARSAEQLQREYRVRFDDKSEQWCASSEMRKLGGGAGGTSHNGSALPANGPMCVACKRARVEDVVEICERCGRGYHRRCTTEAQHGSGNWLCKRCVKPMKIAASLTLHCLEREEDTPRQRTACYCGHSADEQDEALLCCKCQIAYHIRCIDCLKTKQKPLRGDSFFVYGCAPCNRGDEFLRRLQMNWSDVVHLALYNLAAAKPQQHNKCYHLIKDIWPYVLEHRHTMPIPQEWLDMTEAQLMECIKRTVKEHSSRFVCGAEIERNHFYFGLRCGQSGPPQPPKFKVHGTIRLTDELLRHDLKLQLLGAPVARFSKKVGAKSSQTAEQPVKDIYEFRLDEDDDDDDDTTDDEIPIKHIIDKTRKAAAAPLPTLPTFAAKNANKTGVEKAHDKVKMHAPERDRGSSAKNDVSNSNNNNNSHIKATPEQTSLTKLVEKSSRKRKAFTLSKSYKATVDEAMAKRHDSNINTALRLCDSSSDENSSSSRGTSLDVIIPPPKDFLGLNNPFRIVTPKKIAGGDVKRSSMGGSGGNGSVAAVGAAMAAAAAVLKRSIFNTSTLNFSSKLAALKKAGIFPNLSTSDLVKAAGQPRTVRTIKRRLSAKDIMIGPNQEIRRRRTRRISTNVEVISTTTINTIPSNFFPMHAKDFLITAPYARHRAPNQQQPPNNATCGTPASLTHSSLATLTAAMQPQQQQQQRQLPGGRAVAAATMTHGRRLRQRQPPPQSQKPSPSNSRRSSISGVSTSSTNSSSGGGGGGGIGQASDSHNSNSNSSNSDTIVLQDLKQSVNKYFGAVNRIESGEQFSVCAKRQLANGQMQFLIEWGGGAAHAIEAHNLPT